MRKPDAVFSENAMNEAPWPKGVSQKTIFSGNRIKPSIVFKAVMMSRLDSIF
jgi:hypothetical protein